MSRTISRTVTGDDPTGAAVKASVLVEALPYIRRFAGKVVVVKYGGNALAGTSDHDALSVFAEDIVLMRLVGMRPVVVHGGGPQISALMSKLGKETVFVDGDPAVTTMNGSPAHRSRRSSRSDSVVTSAPGAGFA